MRLEQLRQVAWTLVAAIAWAGVAGQFYLAFSNARPGQTFVGVIVSTLSYWTIQTNLFVALACTLPLFASQSAVGRFFARSSVRMVIVVYIVTTGIIYALLLASLWSPQGLQMTVNVLMHYVTPLLFPLSWLLLEDHGRLAWRDGPKVLIYPLVYLGYSLLRGAFIGSYPYPFIDVNLLGAAGVFRNSAGLTLFFLLFAALLIALDRALGRRSAPVPA